MTHRTVTVLAGALVVLGAVALIAQYDPRPPSPGGGLLLPDLAGDLDEITQVTVVGAGSEPVATLQRGEDGGWSVAEKDGYPADAARVRHTLISLAEARVAEAMTSNADFYDRLGVEDVAGEDAGGVAVNLTGADSTLDIIVGNTEGASQRYVRVADRAQSFLIDRDPEVGDETADWLAPGILAIPGARMARVTVTHPDGEVVSVSKADPDQSNFDLEAMPEGRELQYASVANVMGNVLSNLGLQDVEPLSDTDVPVTVTEWATFDGLAITAESFERGDEPWVAFRVEYRPPVETPDEDSEPAADAVSDSGSDSDSDSDSDSEQVPATADGTEDASGGAAEAADEGDESTDEDDGVDVAAEAAELDQRLAGWRYRIASYQYDQMTRRMDDLLRDVPEEPDADD